MDLLQKYKSKQMLRY